MGGVLPLGYRCRSASSRKVGPVRGRVWLGSRPWPMAKLRREACDLPFSDNPVQLLTKISMMARGAWSTRSQMSLNSGSTLADLRKIIADLERQLAECRAERDEALRRETAAAEVIQTINSSPGDLSPIFDAILEKA